MKSPAKGTREFNRIIDNFLQYAIGRVSSIQRYNTRLIIKPQSVMEHEGSVGLIAMVLSDYLNQSGVKNDPEKVLRMAITHDNDESVSGDINFDAKYSHGELSQGLRESLNRLSDYVVRQLYDRIGDTALSNRYYQLYRDEKDKRSVESKIVKMADWIDVIVYARHEQQLGNKKMAEVEKTARSRYENMLGEVLKGSR